MINYIEGSIAELSNILNYTIAILILQIGLIFIKSWYFERGKKPLKNNISLSYGIYYIFLSIGSLVYFLTIYHQISTALLRTLEISSIIIRGIGVVIFSFTIEYYFRDLLKSKYLISISCLILLITIPFMLNNIFFNQALNAFNLMQLLIPFLFTIYFMHNTHGNVQKRLKISVIGISLLFLGLFFTSMPVLQTLKIYVPISSEIVFFSKIIVFIGISFLLYGYTGYSFLLESQWRNNLISFHIIDEKQNIDIYNKIYHPDEIKSSGLFTGGITSMNKIINQFTTSNKYVDVIDFQDKFILLEYGKNIISAMIVRRITNNLRYILEKVNNEFETNYWNYLEDSDKKKLLNKESNINESVEIILEKYIKIK